MDWLQMLRSRTTAAATAARRLLDEAGQELELLPLLRLLRLLMLMRLQMWMAKWSLCLSCLPW